MVCDHRYIREVLESGVEQQRPLCGGGSVSTANISNAAKNMLVSKCTEWCDGIGQLRLGPAAHPWRGQFLYGILIAAPMRDRRGTVARRSH